jgi:hypothetical protein
LVYKGKAVEGADYTAIAGVDDTLRLTAFANESDEKGAVVVAATTAGRLDNKLLEDIHVGWWCAWDWGLSNRGRWWCSSGSWRRRWGFHGCSASSDGGRSCVSVSRRLSPSSC